MTLNKPLFHIITSNYLHKDFTEGFLKSEKLENLLELHYTPVIADFVVHNLSDTTREVAIIMVDVSNLNETALDKLETYLSTESPTIVILISPYSHINKITRLINGAEEKIFVITEIEELYFIHEGIKKFLKRHFEKSSRCFHYVFDNLLSASKKKLEEYFTNRYEIWRKQGWIEEHPRKMEIDEYDLRSHQLCLTENTMETKRIIGGVRFTGNSDNISSPVELHKVIEKNKYGFLPRQFIHQPFIEKGKLITQTSFEELIPGNSQLNDFLNSKSIDKFKFFEMGINSPEIELDYKTQTVKEFEIKEKEKLLTYPAMKIHNTKGELEEFMVGVLKKNQTADIYELGRWWMLRDDRMHCKIDINMRIQEESFAHCIAAGATDLIICCNPLHYRAFIRKYGFVPVNSIPEVNYYKSNSPSQVYHLKVKTLLEGKNANISKNHRNRILLYIKKIKLNKKTPNQYPSCACDNLEACLKDDYLKPINHNTKHLCPIRVSRSFE